MCSLCSRFRSEELLYWMPICDIPNKRNKVSKNKAYYKCKIVWYCRRVSWSTAQLSKLHELLIWSSYYWGNWVTLTLWTVFSFSHATEVRKWTHGLRGSAAVPLWAWLLIQVDLCRLQLPRSQVSGPYTPESLNPLSCKQIAVITEEIQ